LRAHRPVSSLIIHRKDGPEQYGYCPVKHNLVLRTQAPVQQIVSSRIPASKSFIARNIKKAGLTRWNRQFSAAGFLPLPKGGGIAAIWTMGIVPRRAVGPNVVYRAGRRSNNGRITKLSRSWARGGA
jgi:hypothetical protein